MVDIQNNRGIARNTLLLYARMLIIMFISLFTSRIVLRQLGVTDYGIYNVVGGFVTMFSLLSNALTTGITRFITFEIGTGNKEKLKKIFSVSVTIQILLAFAIFVLIEIVGIWFLNNKMNIPADRMLAANVVLQLSVITFCINLISVPYTAVIIAHEHMSAYAYITIFEALLKLAICYLISQTLFDKLILYSILMALIALIIRIVYSIYCSRNFEECKFKFIYDKEKFRSMLSFSGWNMIGASSAVLRDYGVNILLNIFYGPIVNAARGIAMQVSSAVQSFSSNFILAINPQITKNYAAGNMDYSFKLVFLGARLSFYLLFLIALPFFFETEFILNLWLGQVPDYSVSFVKLIIIYVLTESVSYTMVTLMLATGDIKWYQIIVGGCQMLNFPISYIILKLGAQPEWTMVVAILIALGCLSLRLIMLKRMVKLPVLFFCKSVLLNILFVSIVSLILPAVVVSCFPEGLVRFLLTGTMCVCSTIFCVIFLGCNKEERNLVISMLKSKIKKS